VQDLPKIATVFDSEEEQVGEVYAKALLGALRSSPDIDSLLQQFDQIIAEVFTKNPKLEAALNSPKLSQEEKESLLERILGGRVDTQILRFLKVICRRRRLNFIRGIQRSVTELRDSELGRLRIAVTSAFDLTADEAASIKSKLQAKLGKQVSLVLNVDPTVVGGLVLRMGDTVYDGSVAGRFEQLLRATRQGTARALSRDSGSLVS